MTEAPRIDQYGNKFWVNAARYPHREDGPAIEWADGGREWWRNGWCHREDGPAIDKYGRVEWFINDKRHRLDGPAVHCPNGSKRWYINGEELTEEEHAERVKELQKND